MTKSKVLAFFLPQYHEIPENNEWWGAGFTEWTNVKRAKNLFTGHRQPRAPLNANYYNILDESTIEWQTSLANRYGIDGFVYYHYWFNGRRLLERPFDSLLENQSINQRFALAWANEPWTRAWDGGDKQVLMPQEYGGKEEWRAHFEYLGKAFQDVRYICVDNKPMFIIYRPSSIPNLSEMISFWRELATEKGFVGLHVVGMNTYFESSVSVPCFDATLDFEPMFTISSELPFLTRFFRKNITRIRKVWNRIQTKSQIVQDLLDYDVLWKRILMRPISENRYLGAFVDWDNTPRKGTRGLVLTGFSVKKFSTYFKKQYQRSCEADVPFVFVNAWNEWAEGTYLEPDEENKLGLLEAIKKAQSNQ
ncbi:glycoside hydrolase family 99-like domain-containing protein [Bdellovibrio sp. HCB274]|uniref:glycosyltransferase WbsX family protein n=1 Tax=Bdellovibrio sp. HCB274 TaxID=3394361 RepID=UPI0039B42CAA